MTERINRETRRKLRTRNNIRNLERPRLSVHRSNKYIYAQIIDDKLGRTLASAIGDKNTKGAAQVGKKVAEIAIKKGVKLVVFDRGQYKYHGKIKTLAESAREGGLSF